MNLQDEQVKKKKKQSNFWYDLVKITGAPSALIIFRHKTVYLGEGKMPKIKGAALITANHIGFLDPVLLHCVFWRRRLNCLATTELLTSKAKRWFFKEMHCIPVDKQNFSMNSFHDVCDRLKDGKAVVIFPEGQLNEENKNAMLALKSGAALMAHQANAPIVPVYIMPPKKWYNRRVVLMGQPFKVSEVVGERPSLAALNGVSEILRQKELELRQKYEERYQKEKKDD